MKTICAFLITLSLIEIPSVGGAEPPDPACLGFIKGFTWGWVGQRGEYASPAAADSIRKLADTGTEWMCLAFGTNMESYDTPEIRFADANPHMPTDDEIRHAIDLARENGMKVILKPVVNCQDGTWRAWIRFFRPVTDEERAAGITGEMDPWGGTPTMREGMVKNMEEWDQWWQDFTNYIVHYAKIAQEKQVPVFCLGCEMNSTEEFDQKWRALIAEVRKVYSGLLTYDVNHGNEDNVKWFDEVDFISISAYYPIPSADGSSPEEAIQKTTSVEEIRAALEPIRDHLANTSAKWKKPILFIETGVTSVRGCARTPWAHVAETRGRPVDQQEQANYYQAQFEVFWDEPWFMGWCWWDWPAQLREPSATSTDRSFGVYGKQAEQVVREWYAKPRTSSPAE